MEWIADPSIWAGLATLIVLEIVLGIDNLVFIAILADKLPAKLRDKARITGLTCALVMCHSIIQPFMVDHADPTYSNSI